MKEIVKDAKIDVRMTQQEKEAVKQYATSRNMNMGELIRWVLAKEVIIKMEEEK